MFSYFQNNKRLKLLGAFTVLLICSTINEVSASYVYLEQVDGSVVSGTDIPSASNWADQIVSCADLQGEIKNLTFMINTNTATLGGVSYVARVRGRNFFGGDNFEQLSNTVQGEMGTTKEYTFTFSPEIDVITQSLLCKNSASFIISVKQFNSYVTGKLLGSSNHNAYRNTDFRCFGCGNLADLYFKINKISSTNSSPIFDFNSSKVIVEGGNLNFSTSATDPDNDPLTYSATNLPVGSTFINGVFNWTPNFTQAGTYSVTFTVTDGTLTDSETIDIVVFNTNQAPVLGIVSNQSVVENQPLVFLTSASDPDNDLLTYAGTNLPSGAQYNSTTGQFSWTPSSTQSGTYSITFTTSDNELSDSETIDIIVTDDAEPPVLSLIGNKTVTEGSSLEFSIVATDLNDDRVTYSATNLPNGAQLNSATGEFSWTSTFTQAGTYTVTFMASDGVLTDSETIDIIVNNVNRAPVLFTVGNKIISENQTLSFSLSASDVDGDNLTYSALNLPSGSILSGNTFSWTPTYAQAGNYENVEFIVTDNGSPMELDVELVTITVGDVNRTPELSNPGPQAIIEGQNVAFTITVSDPDGDAVILSSSNLPVGAIFNSNTGVFSWNPSDTQAGVYSPTFTATDNGSPIESNSVDVVLTVGDDPTPVEQAQIIIDTIVSFSLPNNVTNSYMANLQKIEPFITAGQIQPALNQLNAFINKVNQDYSQNKITLTQKNQLVSIAQTLVNNLQ